MDGENVWLKNSTIIGAAQEMTKFTSFFRIWDEF